MSNGSRFKGLAVVTGANGMIGRQVVKLLTRQGIRTRVLIRRPWNQPNDVEVVIGDLHNEASLKQLLDGANAVIHCAGELSDITVMHEVNVIGSQCLAQLAIEAGVSVFCHISSAGVIGPSIEAWVDETTPCKPSNPYERSKWEAEQFLQQVNFNATRLCILRPTNVVDDERPGIVLLPLRRSWKDRLSLFLKGGECAHLIHAQDVAAAAIHTLENKKCFGIYFTGLDEDRRNTISGVSDIVNQLQGRPVRNWHLPTQASHWLRRLLRGQSLHGRTRFSSSRLLATGFSFPLGLDGAIAQITRSRKPTC